MACYEYLNTFPKPYKFGSAPAYISRINYDTDDIETIEVTDPSQYIQRDACPYPETFGWLNKKGGYTFFTFTGKHTFGFQTGEAATFISEENEELYADRGKVFDNGQIQSQYISAAEKEFLAEITKSPLVWWYRNVGEDPVRVRVAEGNYTHYKKGENLISMSFNFSVAKFDHIQTL